MHRSIRRFALRLTSYGDRSAAQQLKRLRAASSRDSDGTPNAHRLDVAVNQDGVPVDVISLFPSWGFVWLPNLLGRFKAAERAELQSNTELLAAVRSIMVDPLHGGARPAPIPSTSAPPPGAHSHAAGSPSVAPSPSSCAVEKTAIIVGCHSVAYLDRQLESYGATNCIVLDHDAARLINAAFTLRPKHGHRVSFVRCDAAVVLRYVMGEELVDVVCFAMPVPHASRAASYRRLLTRDVFNVAHRCLKVREHIADPKGIVVFTDHAGYAAFAARQLEESKMVVGWSRKKSDTFRRWLPVPSDGFCPPSKGRLAPLKADDVVFHHVCAAKSSPTTPLAMKVIDAHDYGRHYFEALPPLETHEAIEKDRKGE